MKTIQLVGNDGSPSFFDENKIRVLLANGLLQPETLYWQEGMTEWRPLRELKGPSFARDPQNLTMTLKVLCIILIILNAGEFLNDGASLLFASLDTVYNATPVVENILAEFCGPTTSYMSLGCSVVFFIWIYRANLNCRGFGASGMEFTPGWAVGWFFVPLFNLFRPYEVVSEIWRASNDPLNWEKVRSSRWVDAWWLLWIFSSMTNHVSTYAISHLNRDSTSALWAKMPLLHDIALIALYTVTFFLVEGIYRQQKHVTQQTAAPAGT